MNILERTVAMFSPAAALARARNRQALTVLAERGYDGGALGRRLPKVAPRTSANAELQSPGFALLRARAHDMVRNNAHCARAVEIFASNLVGDGIIPASRTGDRTTDKKVNDLWKWFIEECDAEGQTNFHGLQTLAVRSMFEGGETIGRLRVRRVEDGFKIPLQVQLLEGEYIDHMRTAAPGSASTTLGVEVDGIGRRSAYWLYDQHPGDMAGFGLSRFSSQRVAADNVLHLYRKQRIGQVRGVSAFAPVMLTARDLSELWEAVIIKARTEACFSGFITSDEEVSVGADRTQPGGSGVQEMSPGTLMKMRPGEDVKFAEPSTTTALDPVMLHTLMTIAVGLGLTYDQLTGDLRQANYSSLRAGKIEQRRLVSQLQYQVMVPMFCQPVRRKFLEMAILSGQLKGSIADYPCEWIAPAHEAIDPMKDLQADILAVRSGRMTWPQFVAGWGFDPETQLDDIAAWNSKFDKAEVTLDTDPRHVSQAGLAQQDNAAAAEAAAQNRAATPAAAPDVHVHINEAQPVAPAAVQPSLRINPVFNLHPEPDEKGAASLDVERHDDGRVKAFTKTRNGKSTRFAVTEHTARGTIKTLVEAPDVTPEINREMVIPA